MGEDIAVHTNGRDTGTPAQMGEFVRSEIAKWGKVAKAAGIRVE